MAFLMMIRCAIGADVLNSACRPITELHTSIIPSAGMLYFSLAFFASHDVYEMDHYFLPHLFAAAATAISFRRSGESFSALAFPALLLLANRRAFVLRVFLGLGLESGAAGWLSGTACALTSGSGAGGSTGLLSAFGISMDLATQFACCHLDAGQKFFPHPAQSNCLF